MGLYVWACFVGLFFPWSCGRVAVWSCGRVLCFNACKGKHNKRQQQHKKRLQIKFFNNIMIGKTNDKSKLILPIYIRYENFLQKKLKKICKVIFLLYLCTSETKNKQ